MSHILVIANETAASQTLLDAVRGEAGGDDRVTVIAPVNKPAQGYVVYEDTRRAAAGRRLEKALAALRAGGVAAQGFVAETGPVQAVKDALAQLEPQNVRRVARVWPANASLSHLSAPPWSVAVCGKCDTHARTAIRFHRAAWPCPD